MDVSINWGTNIIFIPKTYLTLVQSTPIEIYNLDINYFRLTLKNLEDNELGISYLKTHIHNTEVSLGGLTFARVVEILDPYTITFEDGQYAVNLIGANSNIGDKINVNQVSVRSQNSAGLISSTAIEYASFNGGVIVDLGSGINGTVFPRGTEQMPVDNLSDALLIATYRGFKKLYLKSDITIDSNYDLSYYEIEGNSHINTRINVEPAAIIDNATISNCEISGTLDGFTTINNCNVGDLLYVNGQIQESELSGKIILDGNLNAYIDNCSQLSISDTPIIDMGVNGQNLVVTNYTGIIKIINFSGSTNTIGIGLSAGYIILDSTSVISGELIISGIGELIDENGDRILTGVWNNGVKITNNLINKDTINEAAQLTSYVYVNQDEGVSGVDFPIGTKRLPSNNLVDAVEIATSLGINDILFLSDFIFDSTVYISNFNLRGISHNKTNFDFNDGSLVINCEIYNATSTGSLSGMVGFYDCKIENLGSDSTTPSSQSLIVERTLFGGVMNIPPNYSGKITVIDSYSDIPGNSTPIINFNGSTCELQLRNYTGGVEFKNGTNNNILSIDLVSGNIKLDNTMTNATIVARGVGKLVESDTGNYIASGIWNGGVSISNDIMSKGTISTAVWDEELSSHIEPGTTGKAMSTLQFGDNIVINATSEYSGTTFPIGTARFPVNNGSDALVISEREKITTFTIQDSLITNADLSDVTIRGESFLMDSLFFNNTSYDKVLFENLTLSGNSYFNDTQFINCFIENITNISGEMIRCRLKNNIKIEPGKELSGVEMVIEGDETTIDLQNTPGTSFSCDINSGYVLIINSVPGCLVDINFKGGEIEFDDSCTGGELYLEGIGNLLNDPNDFGFDITNHLISNESIWDEQLSTHTQSGSTGNALATASSGGVDINLLVDGVWNAPAQSYTDIDSIGYKINKIDTNILNLDIQVKRILGLTQENFRITDHNYSGDNLNTAKIKIYNNNSDCDNDNNPLALYSMTALYDATGKLIDYKVTKD